MGTFAWAGVAAVAWLLLSAWQQSQHDSDVIDNSPVDGTEDGEPSGPSSAETEALHARLHAVAALNCCCRTAASRQALQAVTACALNPEADPNATVNSS